MRTNLALFTLAILACASPAAAKNQGKGKGRAERSGTQVAVSVNFGAPEVRVIREYYGANPASLPPGLQKKLARTGSLPPGWEKRFRPFPPHIEVNLGPLCANCGRGVIDGCAVIYDKRTRIILDIVQLAADIAR
jgi:hypothetical protein